MGEATSKYYQRCDFCHKEIEVSERGMDKIRLPGYVYDDGAKQRDLYWQTFAYPALKD